MDLAPLDQLEKCRKPDYRHLEGGSRRCDETSFLLHTSGSAGAPGEQSPGATRPELLSPELFRSSWRGRGEDGCPDGWRAAENQLVRLEIQTSPTSRDKYGRLLAFVFRQSDNLLVNKEIIRHGMGTLTRSIRSTRAGWRSSGQRNARRGSTTGDCGDRASNKLGFE